MRALAALLLSVTACRVAAPEPPPIVDVEPPTAPDTTALTGVPNPLVLGLVPVFAPDQMVKQFSPLGSYLGRELDTTVELRLAESYDEIIEMVQQRQVDLAQLSPFVYVTAKERAPEIQLIATNIAEGSSTYSGYIVARADLNIDSVGNLKGLRFGFVDEHSASGYLYPTAFLMAGGLMPMRDFREVVYTGRHDALMNHLLAGHIDAGATFSGALIDAEDRGLDLEQIRDRRQDRAHPLRRLGGPRRPGSLRGGQAEVEPDGAEHARSDGPPHPPAASLHQRVRAHHGRALQSGPAGQAGH